MCGSATSVGQYTEHIFLVVTNLSAVFEVGQFLLKALRRIDAKEFRSAVKSGADANRSEDAEIVV